MNTLLRHRPSPAMVVACIALAIALGGTSYAAIRLPANSVGTKQLKKNAVKRSKIAAGAVNGSKVASDSLTGANILESSLGPVPSATNATTATNATHATSADSATSATSATHATSADSATNATHADSADSATNSGHATNADHATTADSVPALTFTNLTLKNGWVGGASCVVDLGVPQVAKSSEGVVYFRGALCRPSGTSNIPFAVPAGFAPSKEEYIPVTQLGSATGLLRVFLGGNVALFDDPDHPSAALLTSLAGASYTLPY